jgi:hypothetical protein
MNILLFLTLSNYNNDLEVLATRSLPKHVLSLETNVV